MILFSILITYSLQIRPGSVTHLPPARKGTCPPVPGGCSACSEILRDSRALVAAAFRLVKAVKPGGKLLVWLYGYENNEWLIRYFNPVRKFLFSKMPLPLVYGLSFPATAMLWSFLKLGFGRTEYMCLIRSFSFRHLRAIVYDHMIPIIALYYTKNEAIRLLEESGLVDISAHWVNEMSWTVIGIKPDSPAP